MIPEVEILDVYISSLRAFVVAEPNSEEEKLFYALMLAWYKYGVSQGLGEELITIMEGVVKHDKI